MVVLADELLEQFFESSFPASFRISDKMLPALPSASSSLTTFSSLRPSVLLQGSGVGGTGSAGAVPPGKGLRGVLDNIVTDGMRVAAEVKRRMDEAQKEMEKNAVNRPATEDDDEEEDYDVQTPAGRRTVRSEDRDLLEGADAEAISIKSGMGMKSGLSPLPPTPTTPGGSLDGGRSRNGSTSTQKVMEVEFER